MVARRVSGFGIGLILLALLVGVPALLIARIHGFDGLYGQDAFAYAGYGLGPLREALLAGHALPDFPLPPGYPMVVAVVSLALGPADAVAQWSSILTGAFVPVLVALLAREILPDRDTRLAILAGLVAAVAGQLWQSSLVSMSDTPALAAACLGAWSATRFNRTGGRGWLILAAAAFALAVETRLIYGVVAIAMGLVLGAGLRGDLRLARGRAVVSALLGAAAALIVLAPAIASIVAAIAAGRPIPFAAEFGVAAFDPLTPFRSSFTTADGRLDYAWPMAAWYLLQPVHWYWLGALGLAVPVGILSITRGARMTLPQGATLLAWPGLVVLVLVFYPYQNPRFSLAFLPPVAILAAIGLERIVATVTNHRAAARPFVLIGLAAVFVATAALAWRYTDGFVTRQTADLAAIRSLEMRIPAASMVVSIGATPVLRHDGLAVTELYDLPDSDARVIEAGGPFFVLVDAVAMETQWSGTPTGQAFEALATAKGFAAIGQAGAWTLFAAGG